MVSIKFAGYSERRLDPRTLKIPFKDLLHKTWKFILGMRVEEEGFCGLELNIIYNSIDLLVAFLIFIFMV